ncbi:cytosolic phospholipase A2 gamma-like [Chanodichthys erythropterus]
MSRCRSFISPGYDLDLAGCGKPQDKRRETNISPHTHPSYRHPISTITFTNAYSMQLIHRECKSEVRIAHSLNQKEEFVARRRKTVQQSLWKLHIYVPLNKVPNIALLGSGGGQRAMVGLLGSLDQLQKAGLLDCILYLSGVSGSTWCMASLYQESDWSTKLQTVKDKIIQRLSSSKVSWKEAFDKMMKYYNRKEDFPSWTYLWAAMVITAYVKEINEHKLTEQWNHHSKDPFPIYTAIDKECKQSRGGDPWFEFTPYEAGYSLIGAFVETSSFGSHFENGCKKNDHPEIDMLYLQALCGSAIADEEENDKFIWERFKERFGANYILDYLDAVATNLNSFKDLNWVSKSEPLTLSGRLFQSLGAKCENALPPLVDKGTPTGDHDSTPSLWSGYQTLHLTKHKTKLSGGRWTRGGPGGGTAGQVQSPRPKARGEPEEQTTGAPRRSGSWLNARAVLEEMPRRVPADLESWLSARAVLEEVTSNCLSFVCGSIMQQNIHCKRENHIMDWDNARVIRAESNKYHRWIREAIEIRKCAPRTMNRDEGAYTLSHTWDVVLEKASDKWLLGLTGSWIWGRNYNFLYNMEDERVPHDLLKSETRDYEDAGLLLNSPYFSVLRKERDIDLIISLDFSDGDPFMTVKKAAKMCKELNIPFPEVKIHKQDVKKPKDFYVFKGRNAPTVIHIPLFNVVNCGDDIETWRNKYATFQSPYSAEMITDLMEVAGKNIIYTRAKLLEEIRVVTETKIFANVSGYGG